MIQISAHPLTPWLHAYLERERSHLEAGINADFSDFPEDMQDFMREEHLENVIKYLDNTLDLISPKEGETHTNIGDDQLPQLIKGLTHWRLYLREHALHELSDSDLEVIEDMTNLPENTDPMAMLAYVYLATLQGYAIQMISGTLGRPPETDLDGPDDDADPSN